MLLFVSFVASKLNLSQKKKKILVLVSWNMATQNWNLFLETYKRGCRISETQEPQCLCRTPRYLCCGLAMADRDWKCVENSKLKCLTERSLNWVETNGWSLFQWWGWMRGFWEVVFLWIYREELWTQIFLAFLSPIKRWWTPQISFSFLLLLSGL